MTAGGLQLALSQDSLETIVDAVSERVAARVAERLHEQQQTDRWMATPEAARYMGRSPAALHKLTAARAIPFAQEGPGAKCYFKRSDIDSYMAAS